MASREQAIEILERLKEIHPVMLFKDISDIHEGSKFVLGYLSENGCKTYASSLCEIMNISRARMSILLEKLIQKGFIKKTVSNLDARKEVISITKLGCEEILNKKQQLENSMIKIIDNIGFDKLNEFINIAKQIKDIMKS